MSCVLVMWVSSYSAADQTSPLARNYLGAESAEQKSSPANGACKGDALQFLDDWKAKLWSRFFCLSVYVTMYLNDHQRAAFYGSLGLDTTVFNRQAISFAIPVMLSNISCQKKPGKHA